MIVLKLKIFVTLFLLTKQEQYWKYFPSNEFSTKNMSTHLDLKAFTKYEQLSEFNTNLHCLIIYEPGAIQLIGQSKNCSSNNTFTTDFGDMMINNRSCALFGNVRNVENLRNSGDDNDELIFIALEGCYTIDESNGSISSGTLIMTNNIETDYEILQSKYMWTQIDFGNIISCNILCTNVVLEHTIVVNVEIQSRVNLVDEDDFWNFLRFDEFKTRDTSANLDMEKFTKYEYSKGTNLNLNCLVGYGVDEYYLVGQSIDCCNIGVYNKMLLNEKATYCPLQGAVETVQFLRNKDIRDNLIFISVEGCYTIDEFGNNSTGTVIMTNNITTSYDAYKSDYVWTEIGYNGLRNCSLLCSNIVLDRCFDSKIKTRLMSPFLLTQTFKYAVLNIDEQKMDFVYMKIILIILSIIFITIFLTVLIFKMIAATKIEMQENEKF